MFESLKNIFKKNKKRDLIKSNSKDKAKERLHLVLMQDRANVSADFLDLMRREIIEVIKKYIDIDEAAMDVRLTTQSDEDGVQTAPALYANIPIINIKDETRKLSKTNQENKLPTEPPKTENNNEEQKNKEKLEENNKTINSESKVENNDTTNRESSVKNENDANKDTASKDGEEKNEPENSNPQPENSKNETKENIENLEEEKKNEE